MLDSFNLDGRTSIVTGGNRGIGKAIARGLAEAGSDVVIANRTPGTGREAARAIDETTTASAVAVPTDVSVESEVEKLAARTVDEFGSIDVLVNNAGIAIHGGAEEKPLEEWREPIDINLTGTFLCSKHAGNVMIDSGGGSIVNVTSMSAFVANYPQRHVDYQASKGGWRPSLGNSPRSGRDTVSA
nr:SDR family NAD(P)-dependent oxidoreductase [Halovivax sp.]